MKPRLLFTIMVALALTLTGGGYAVAAPTKCTGASKTKSCKSAPTSAASKGRSASAGKKQAGKKRATKSGKIANVRHTLAGRLAVAKKQAARARAADDPITLRLDEHGQPRLSSSAFYVANQNTGEILLQKNARAVIPIASITKLMTAIVVLESRSDLHEMLTITDSDVDYLKGTHSRLGVGTRLTREDMLHLALMSSENRAASALARHYPGGRAAFIEAMNVKARLIGMTDTRFYDSTGLTPRNVSSPRDLSRLVIAASGYAKIREFSTTEERYIYINGHPRRFGNTNGLVKSADWVISVSKTGYISEAGRCLVMQAWMQDQPLVIVLMDANGRNMRTVDAQRVRLWLEERPERLAATRREQQG
ncbi:MAG: serine hydrolase [Betaproteobacteria bacterium]|jgi:D-alanyl-D-alanine endopeptidase (penicillin-binding protein 7)|nr:serine hydrolase [Betaproteobacteria bacterium]